ncbi:hypothetical protein T09_15151 [Trichinella sp. T9]|nr:hypothetical protein T09_15151 [Trichinella sp. T9]
MPCSSNIVLQIRRSHQKYSIDEYIQYDEQQNNPQKERERSENGEIIVDIGLSLCMGAFYWSVLNRSIG